jgi:hypothetical protein
MKHGCGRWQVLGSHRRPGGDRGTAREANVDAAQAFGAIEVADVDEVSRQTAGAGRSRQKTEHQQQLSPSYL